MALSFASPRPGITRHAARLEFGLSSPALTGAITWPARSHGEGTTGSVSGRGRAVAETPPRPTVTHGCARPRSSASTPRAPVRKTAPPRSPARSRHRPPVPNRAKNSRRGDGPRSRVARAARELAVGRDDDAVGRRSGPADLAKDRVVRAAGRRHADGEAAERAAPFSGGAVEEQRGAGARRAETLRELRDQGRAIVLGGPGGAADQSDEVVSVQEIRHGATTLSATTLSGVAADASTGRTARPWPGRPAAAGRRGGAAMPRGR